MNQSGLSRRVAGPGQGAGEYASERTLGCLSEGAETAMQAPAGKVAAE